MTLPPGKNDRYRPYNKKNTQQEKYAGWPKTIKMATATRKTATLQKSIKTVQRMREVTPPALLFQPHHPILQSIRQHVFFRTPCIAIIGGFLATQPPRQLLIHDQDPDRPPAWPPRQSPPCPQAGHHPARPAPHLAQGHQLCRRKDTVSPA